MAWRLPLYKVSGGFWSLHCLKQAVPTYLRIVEFGASESCPRLLNAAFSFSFSFCEPRAGLAVSSLHPIARSRQVYIELIVEALLITSGSLDALTKEEFRDLKAKASGDVSSVQILLSQQLALVGEARELKEASRQGIKRSADANTVIDGVIDGALDGVRGLTTGALKQSGLITCFEVVK